MSSSFTPDDQTQTREIPRVTASGRPGVDHRDLVARQREEFGGMRFGAGFFGWLAATGMAVLLTVVAAAVAALVGYGKDVNTGDVTSGNLQTAGVVGGITLLVIVLLSYFAGGYVAGRMARFDGVKQGIAVWIWAVIVSIVVGITVAIAGSKINLPSRIGTMPSLSSLSGNTTMASIIAVVGVAVISLIGAILGGLAGMRYHRRIDRVSAY